MVLAIPMILLVKGLRWVPRTDTTVCDGGQEGLMALQFRFPENTTWALNCNAPISRTSDL